MTTFEPGRTYLGRFISDSDSVIRLTVARRTAKTITTDAGKTLRVWVHDGEECVRPFGNYSMAPIIGAAKLERTACTQEVTP